MPADRYPPDDPREWLNRSRSNLAHARAGLSAPEVYVEDLCFDTQQAAEKALKAVLLHRGVAFPYSHNVGLLLDLIESSGLPVPGDVRETARLTRYAVLARYPALGDPLTPDDYERAVALAQGALDWAQSIVDPGSHPPSSATPPGTTGPATPP